jgi:hypothetical protein
VSGVPRAGRSTTSTGSSTALGRPARPRLATPAGITWCSRDAGWA